VAVVLLAARGMIMGAPTVCHNKLLFYDNLLPVLHELVVLQLINLCTITMLPRGGGRKSCPDTMLQK
jgi:hypothetical protein